MQWCDRINAPSMRTPTILRAECTINSPAKSTNLATIFVISGFPRVHDAHSHQVVLILAYLLLIKLIELAFRLVMLAFDGRSP